MSGSDPDDSNLEDDPLEYEYTSQLNSSDEEDDESFEPSSSGTTDGESDSSWTDSSLADDEEPRSKKPRRKALKRSLKNYEWKNKSHPPSIVVSQNSSTVNVKEEHISLDPLTIFYKYFDDPFIQLVVKLSNDNASRNGKTLELTDAELKAYFGMIIIMSFHKLPRLKYYWHSDQNLCVPRISKIMRLRRFLEIGCYLCFSTQANVCKKGEQQETDFGLVQPLLDHLNEKFCQIRHPSQPLSIDESTVRPKNQNEQLRRSGEKYFSVLAVGCGKTGYIFRVNVRGAGKDFRSDCDNRVRDLMLPFEGRNYCVYVARKHSSFPLVEELYEKQIFVCCALEQNDPNIPSDVRTKRLKIETGHFVQCGDFSITKWKDSQRHYSYILSSFHDPGRKDSKENNKNCERSEEPSAENERSDSSGKSQEEEEHSSSDLKTAEVTKNASKYPKVVMDYYTHKQGVGFVDNRRLKYSTSWKCYSWTKRLFHYMLDVTVVNSHLVYESSWESMKHRESEKRLSAVEFRSELANSLIGGFGGRKLDSNELQVRHELHMLKRGKSKLSRGIHSTAKNSTRLQDVGRHLPIKSKIRRCASCSMRGREKRSTVSCKQCNVGLCIPCFAPFHMS